VLLDEACSEPRVGPTEQWPVTPPIRTLFALLVLGVTDMLVGLEGDSTVLA
jgi:hypothetical protein